MFCRLGSLVVLLISMWAAGYAQTVALDSTPPSRAQVLKFMSAMGVQQSIDASLKSTQSKLKLSARSSFLKKNPGADEATLKKLDAVFDSTPLFTFDSLADTIVPVYQKNLSAADVQAGIDFYTSDAGKRLLAKVPVILRESNESGGQLVAQKLKAYSEELERKLETFQTEVDQQSPQAAEKSKTENKSAVPGSTTK